MTTTKTNIKIVLINAFFVAMPVIAQSDLESWHEVGFNFDMGKKTELYWTHQLRLDNNSSEIKKYQSEAGIDYRLAKRTTASGGYRYARYHNKGYYNNEHRGIALVKYAPRFQRFVLELQTRTDYIAKAAGGYVRKEELVWRNKLVINYKWPTQQLTFFASYEHFTLMLPQTFADKYRFIAGGRYLHRKKMGITAFWGFEKPFEPKEEIIYVAGWKITYNLYKKTKRKSYIDND